MFSKFTIKSQLTRTKKGLTLIELLIVLAISGFVVGAAYSMLDSASRVTDRSSSQVREQDDLRNAITWITRDLQNVTPDKVVQDIDPYYDISGVQYKLVQTGAIGSRKVYNIVRTSAKEEFVIIESVPEFGGLKIDSSSDNFYKVTVTTIDKHNLDRVTSFNVAIRTGDFVKSASRIAANASISDTVQIVGNPCVAVDTTKDSWVLTLTSGTVKNAISNIDIVLKDLPQGLNYNVTKGTGNTINIKLSGTALNPISQTLNVGLTIKGSAVTESGYLDSTEIVLKLLPIAETFRPEQYMLCSSMVVINNNATIYGDILMGDGINPVYIYNNSSFYGDVYINSDTVVSNNVVFGTTSNPVEVYVKGDINFHNRVEVFGDLYYEGNLTESNKGNFYGKKVKTAVNIPVVKIPELKSEQWYKENGYTIVNTSWENVNLSNGGKYYFKDNYYFNNNFKNSYQDITIVGSKNLVFNQKFKCSGIIFAPKGEITVNNGCNFTGIIISNKTTLNNNIKLTYKVYGDLPY